MTACGANEDNRRGDTNAEISTMRAEKYDWRSKIRESRGIVASLAKSETKVEPPAKSEKKPGGRFKETIAASIALVEAEQQAQREREAAERARLEKARDKARIVLSKAIVPLLNDLRDDFAADGKEVLPQWEVQSGEETDIFSGTAVTPDLAANGSTYFSIRAEAAVVEQGGSLNLSVVCSYVDPKSTSTTQLAPLYSRNSKFAIQPKFDEPGSQVWFHRHLAECARMCVLTKMRQLSNSESESDLLAPAGV
jgi:hypothetical protein